MYTTKKNTGKSPFGWRKIMAAALSSLLLVGLLAGCGSSDTVKFDTWGRADAKEIDVNAKVPGRVVRLLVKEGDQVKAGQLMAVIDQRDLMTQKSQIEAEIMALQAQLTQAQSVTSMQEGTTGSDVTAANTQVSQAQANLDNAKADYDRYAQLVDEGAVSAQSFDAISTKYKVAQETYNQAVAGAGKATAALQQTDVNKANEAAVAQKIVSAQAKLDQINVALSETEIRAPYDGIITTKYIEEGSMISQGTPIVAVQDPTDNWVDFKVPETALAKIKLNQNVTLVGRDGTTTVEGEIVNISKKAEFATQRATSERGDDTDVISFNVKVQVNSEVLRPGMRFKVDEGSL
ncbi:HlyD family secretion protein [Megasphaera vaginalis (ex Bordigoni et al. 2020)]|uniref:HlyD family secretion protein n=1 Tax=Megasphaera vaginalis (ex Bordigoni et al. 2020) TaxID=2045301 RepID=UPI001F24E184|nr:HlyD family efflux transporter periplasmic adaptor subunit [Megasphaera vaginalis (ex Bordigoni et al. 2020)]